MLWNPRWFEEREFSYMSTLKCRPHPIGHPLTRSGFGLTPLAWYVLASEVLSLRHDELSEGTDETSLARNQTLKPQLREGTVVPFRRDLGIVAILRRFRNE